jgi:choice-of-anchor A domain-containing protein
MGLTTISILLLLAVANLEIANARTCEKLLQPQDYLVCSGSDITYYGSDFQGPACAVGNVNVTQFALDSRYSNNCQSWTVGGNYKQGTGSADGNITVGGNVTLGAVRVAGELQHGGNLSLSVSNVLGGLKPISPAVPKEAVASAWKFFEDQSKAMADKKATSKTQAFNKIMTLSNQGQFQVFEIDAKDLQSVKVIKISGTCATPFIINIKGESAIISETDIQISKGLESCIGNIFFNFPQAKSVILKKSGTRKFGVPGTILAPQAKLDFSDDLVTGGVFARYISGSGQVNFSKPTWLKDQSNQGQGTSAESSKCVSK